MSFTPFAGVPSRANFTILATETTCGGCSCRSPGRKSSIKSAGRLLKKGGGGQVWPESALAASNDTGEAFDLNQLVGEEPTPELLVMLEEQNRRLLDLLRDDRLRQIAMLRIRGYTVVEIAGDLSISVRSVERKLQLIRNQWRKELRR